MAIIATKLATPKGWSVVEVRPSYNSTRKLKKILDDMFKPKGDYKIQGYRDRWVIMTPRELTKEELDRINKPREDAIAAVTKAEKNVGFVANFVKAWGVFRHPRKGAKETTTNENETEDNQKAKTEEPATKASTSRAA